MLATFLWNLGHALDSGPAISADQVSNIGLIMGDLNFRLIPPKTKVAGSPTENDDDTVWAAVLLDSEKRAQLFQRYDGFRRDAANTILECGQWTFPIPKENYDFPPKAQSVCFPTYKRDYSEQAATYVAAIKGKSAGDPGAIDAIRRLFKLSTDDGAGGFTDISLWNKKRSAWDMGWLDRIGYLIRNPSNNKKITYRDVSCWDCFEMVQSDHTPVFMQLTVDVHLSSAAPRCGQRAGGDSRRAKRGVTKPGRGEVSCSLVSVSHWAA
jgi:hypothetical protein